MAVANSLDNRERHPFKPRTVGSVWLGPADETCHWCGCDPRNEVHQTEEAPCSGAPEGWQCILDRGHEPPCCMTPTRDLACAMCEPVVTDEVLQARVAALVASLRAVMRLVDKGAFAWPKEQSAMWTAEAILVEAEGWEK